MNTFVTAKKDGKIRKFPQIGLEKMGKDPNGKTYDGWEIIDDIEDPAELKEAKAKKVANTGKRKSTTKKPDESQNVNDEDNGNPKTDEGAASGSDDSGSEG